MSFRDRVKAIVDSEGETVTYRRVTGVSRVGLGRTNTVTDYIIKAHVRRYNARQLSGKVQEGDRQVRIPASTVAFTPIENDQILFGTNEFNIISVDSRNSRNSDLLHILQIRGS